MELSLLTTLSTKIWVDFGKHCERFSSLGHFRMLPTPGHFPTQMFPDFFNRRVMFNGTSVITHVIVSIWHQPTSPMISSVQMYSSFINLGQNEVTITPNQSSRLEFALTCNSFPHSFHSLELTCCVAGFQGFWVGFLALVLRQAWHCRHHDTCQGSLVKSQIWWQKDVCLKNLKHYFAGHFWYCSQKMWNIRNCSNQNELQDTAWTGAPRSNPSHFKRSNYFFLVSGFQIFFSGVTSRLSFFWVEWAILSRCFSCPLEVVSPLFRAATGRLMACMDLSRRVTGATILAVGSWLFGFQSWSFRVTKWVGKGHAIRTSQLWNPKDFFSSKPFWTNASAWKVWYNCIHSFIKEFQVV